MSIEFFEDLFCKDLFCNRTNRKDSALLGFISNIHVEISSFEEWLDKNLTLHNHQRYYTDEIYHQDCYICSMVKISPYLSIKNKRLSLKEPLSFSNIDFLLMTDEERVKKYGDKYSKNYGNIITL